MKNRHRSLVSGRTARLAALAIAFAGASPRLVGQSVTLDFGADAFGSKPPGFSSVASSLLQFANLDGGDLQIGLLGTKANGRALIVFRDESGGLAMTFSQPMNALSLAFGNDDAAFTTAGDQARLVLFRAGVEVGAVTVVLNRNGVMDQTIAYSGRNFDRAEFFFANAAGDPISLIEVVDDIAFTVGPAAPPPAPLGLIITPSDGTVTLQWQAVVGAADYTVWRAASGGPYQVLADALLSPNYTDGAVTNGVSYSYRVTANNSAGEGAVAAGSARPLAALTAADLAAPRINIADGHFEFRLPGALGRTYRVQSSTTLAPGSWQDAGPLVSGTGGELLLKLLFDPALARQFYRVIIDVESDGAGAP